MFVYLRRLIESTRDQHDVLVFDLLLDIDAYVSKRLFSKRIIQCMTVYWIAKYSLFFKWIECIDARYLLGFKRRYGVL